jgi:hypothetical protein
MECHLQSSIMLLELSTMLPESSIMLLENIFSAGIIYDGYGASRVISEWCRNMECHSQSSIMLLELSTMLPE